MTRQRTIVGLGETVLVDSPDRREASGLAAIVAIQAVRLGDKGVCISRVGQDEAANQLVELLKDAGVDTSHLQRDPDLPTGRAVVRADGSRFERYLDAPAAFDNLQADFDLEDVAQQADAVVYSPFTRRSGQTRSEEERFLNACPAAIKVFDLTNRIDIGFDRGHAALGLDRADIAVLDEPAATRVHPAYDAGEARATALKLIRDHQLTSVVWLEPAGAQQRATIHTQDESRDALVPAGRTQLVTFVLAIVHGMLRGSTLPAALETATGIASHAAEHPGEPIPPMWKAS